MHWACVNRARLPDHWLGPFQRHAAHWTVARMVAFNDWTHWAEIFGIVDGCVRFALDRGLIHPPFIVATRVFFLRHRLWLGRLGGRSFKELLATMGAAEIERLAFTIDSQGRLTLDFHSADRVSNHFKLLRGPLRLAISVGTTAW
jgi:hypothetical protein